MLAASCRLLQEWQGKEVSESSMLGQFVILSKVDNSEHAVRSFVPILAKQVPYAVGKLSSLTQKRRKLTSVSLYRSIVRFLSAPVSVCVLMY